MTSADRGLGYELVRQFVERGDYVFAGKYRTRWNLLTKLKERFPDRMQIVGMDVSSTQSVRAAADEILKQTDKIDILINNAGVWLSDGSGTVLEDKFDYDRMITEFNINALGAACHSVAYPCRAQQL